MENKSLSYVVGGVSDEKKSNGGTQYYMQDRVYLMCDLALSITTSFNPYYLIKNDKNKSDRTNGQHNRSHTRECK